jgi:hypothetical protein
LFERSLREKNLESLWSATHVAYFLIRPKSKLPIIRHDGTLSIGNFMLMIKKPKNLFGPVHPKIVLFLASVVHAISCLFVFYFEPQNLKFIRKSLFWKIEDKKVFTFHSNISAILVFFLILTDSVFRAQKSIFYIWCNK